MNARELQAALAQPFAIEDLEWRLQRTIEESMAGLAVPYVTNRAIQGRLDEVMGIENWRNEYLSWHGADQRNSQLCGISLYFEGKGWVTKWDGAENSDIEPVKGGLSDSMKRAAVQWGIGRILYNMEPVWVDIEKKGKSFFIKKAAYAKLNDAYLSMLKSMKPEASNPTGIKAQPIPESPKQPVTSSQPAAPVLEPDYEYTVKAAKIQKGLNGESTSLTLENREGKSCPAFCRGAMRDLAVGVRLKNVKLTLHKQDTVAFYVLEHYEIAARKERAA